MNNVENVNQAYIDENGNPVMYTTEDGPAVSIGSEIANTVDQNTETLNDGNPTDSAPSTGEVLIDENTPTLKTNEEAPLEEQKEMLTGMVTFDYSNVPIADIVNSIILDAIKKGASDIHFDPFPEGIKVRIRIDGVLHDYSIVPLYVKKNMITRIKIISSMNITETRLPQDGAIRTELADRTIDLRVACLPTSMGEKIVIRIMDYSMSARGIDALDFSPSNLEKVKKLLELPNGIILVTGATGTGKSTTVYSMLQVLNKETSNIITVEDPIEMNIGGINQIQAQEDIGLNFATVLRSILREDPDVIMIGEIRDDETARIAIRASITGHLVLSTIHTNNSLNTIERLRDMSVERYLLGSSLEGVISQKLARRLCEKCKIQRPTTEYEKSIFKKALNKDVNEIYVPVGCPYCDGGYRGRIAIHEVLTINQKIRDAIVKGVDKPVLRKLVYENGHTTTMLQDGLEKVLQGYTSFEEIIKMIDLEDDLGTDTQLGLQNQLEDSSKEEKNETTTKVQEVVNKEKENKQVEQTGAAIQQKVYPAYPVKWDLDINTLKKILTAIGYTAVPTKDYNNIKTELNVLKQREASEPVEELTEDKPKEVYKEDIKKEIKKDIKEEIKEELEEEEEKHKKKRKKNKHKDEEVQEESQQEEVHEEKQVKEIQTINLNEFNTVLPIPLDNNEEKQIEKIMGKNYWKNKKRNNKNKDGDLNIVPVKKKKKEGSLEVVTNKKKKNKK